jgi:hypothetical protein
VPLEVGAATTINAHEVRDDRLVVELALARQLPGQPDMLDVVAEDAERAEAFETLDMRRVVVAPDLVAVQLTARAANAATVAREPVDLASQLIPRWSRQHIAQVGIPARLRHQLDSQA